MRPSIDDPSIPGAFKEKCDIVLASLDLIQSIVVEVHLAQRPISLKIRTNER